MAYPLKECVRDNRLQGGLPPGALLGLYSAAMDRSLVREHLPLVASLGTFIFVLLRVLAVSNFNMTTATAVVQRASPTAVLLGLGVQALGMACGAAFLMLTSPALEAGAESRWSDARIGGAAAAAIIGSLTAPAVIVWLVVGVILLRRVVYGRWGSPEASSRPSFTPQAVNRRVGVFVGAFAIIAVSSGPPWVPPEAVTVDGDTFEAFVVHSDDSWTDLLLESSREVRRHKSSDIAERLLCEPSSIVSYRTIPQYFVAEVERPPCP